MTEYLRLAFATAVVLLPGRLVARSLGQRSGSATLAWGLGAIFVALALVFAVHSTLRLALAVLLLVAIGAVLFRRHRGQTVFSSDSPRWRTVFVAGALFGIALWHVANAVTGDALFHLGRVRKLDAFGGLHLRSVDEFRDGGLHPGYAFPLWHGFLALVSKLSGLDPAVVVRHEASVLAPIAFLVAFEAGYAVFRTVAGGVAVLLAQVALYSLAAGHGGSYTSLDLPPTAARQLLVPAVIALFFTYVERRDRRLLGAILSASLALALVHPTYAIFVGIPLGGYLVARRLLARTELRETAAALAALVVPTVGTLLWLRPIVAETRSHNPSPAEKTRALVHYGSQLDVWSLHRYRLAPEVLGRGGSVAVAALVLIPLAALAGRRRWAALVLGGSVAVLALMLIPVLFTHFSDAVSLSQSRRAAGFLPFAFAFAGGVAVAARFLGPVAPVAALAAGIALQLAWPGDFAYRLVHGGPELATWIAAVGGAAALAGAAVWRRSLHVEPGALAALAAAAFVLPVALHGFSHWTPREPSDPHALSPQLVRELRSRVPKHATVFADLETSYRIAAYAPVYVVAAPPAHVADTKHNRPYGRERDVRRFLRTHDLAIPRRYGATWIVDERGRLYRLPR